MSLVKKKSFSIKDRLLLGETRQKHAAKNASTALEIPV
jgi:hypothetical protein